jgi:catechol 2,3-dioxygenase-like lactoylglutathione lyase family enzyme
MKRFHITLSVADLDASIADYSTRLGHPPQTVVAGAYAMWRTDSLNFSIKREPEHAGQLRHLGFEDDEVRGVVREADVNGIAWEKFSALAQEQRVISTYGAPEHQAAEDELIRN